MRMVLAVPSLALSMFFGWPQRSAMVFRLCSAFRSCSFFSSSAAFLRSRAWQKCEDRRVRTRTGFGGEGRNVGGKVLVDLGRNFASGTHPEFLLPFRGHETAFAALLGLGRLLETPSDLGLLALLLLHLPLFFVRHLRHCGGRFGRLVCRRSRNR